MPKIKLLFITVFVSALVLAPGAALAHLDAGQDILVGKYIIDFGYSPLGPTAGGAVDIALNLKDAKTEKLIVPHHVWVRISQGDDIIFAGNFAPQAQNVTFKQVFNYPGDFNLDLQFFNNAGAVLATTTALLTVAEPGPQTTSNLIESRWIEYINLLANPSVLVLLSLWSLIWKGLALWRAATRKSKPWFVVLLVVNTMGLLEIIYLIISRPKSNANTGQTPLPL